jgi:adenylyl-sulfate kinase
MQTEFRGLVVWLTGLSGAGKTSIATRVHDDLTRRGFPTALLDGDDMRKTLSADLGFSEADRRENVKRISQLAIHRATSGAIVLVSAISPFSDQRSSIRLGTSRYIEVFVDSPLNVCEARDPKGLYRLARLGLLSNFTGIDSPYDVPVFPEVHCKTDEETPMESANKVLLATLAAYTA